MKRFIALFSLTALLLSLGSCTQLEQEPTAEAETTAAAETTAVTETRGPVPTKPDMLSYKEYLKYLRDSLPKEGQLISAGDFYALGISPEGKVLYAGHASEEDVHQNFGTSYQAAEFQNVVQVCAKPDDYATALLEDGTIVMTEKGRLAHDEGQWEAQNWTDMVSFSASDYTTIGIKKDGSIAVAGGGHPFDWQYREWGKEWPIPEWKNLKQFVLMDRSHLAGIDDNGELVYAQNHPIDAWSAENNAAPSQYWSGGYWSPEDLPKVWNDLVDLADGYGITAGVRENGGIVVGGPDQIYDDELAKKVSLYRPSWIGIVDIEVMGTILVGLTEKGTIQICNANASQPIDPLILKAAEWTDLVDISTGSGMIIGVQSDGTVLAAGYPQSVVKEINTWKVSPWPIDRDIPHEVN